MPPTEIVQIAVARIEERQKSIDEKIEKILQMAEDIDERVRVLEAFRWKLAGFATVGVIVVEVAIKYIFK